MNYQELTNVCPTKVYKMTESGSDFITSKQAWLNDNSIARTVIQNGGYFGQNRPVDCASSAIGNKGIEIRNEWKRGERRVVVFPWTPGDSVAFEFQKCRCAECLRCGTEAEREIYVNGSVAGIHKSQVRNFFPAVDIDRVFSTQRKNVDLPLREVCVGDGYKPRDVCDLYPREMHAKQNRDLYGYTGYNREVNGREFVTHSLNPARQQVAEPAATSRIPSNLVGHTAKDKTMKDYLRCFENSFSNAIGKGQSPQRIVKNAVAPISNATASLLRNGVVYSEARKHALSYRECKEAHPSGVVVTSTTSTYLRRQAVDPCVPASAQNNGSHFLYNGRLSDRCHQGLGGSNSLRMRREVETKQTSQTNCIQNTDENFGRNRLTEEDASYSSSALKRPANQQPLHHSSENLPQSSAKGSVSLRLEDDVPNIPPVDVVCKRMEGFQKLQSDHKKIVEETKKPEVSRKTTRSLQTGKAIKRACTKLHQNGKAKRRRRSTNLSCVEVKIFEQSKGSCADLAEQTLHLNSGRSANDSVETCPPSDSKKNIRQEEMVGREECKILENSVNVKPCTGETCRIPLVFDQSRAREERIKNLKMLQVEQERALDKLLIKRPICLESEFTCDLENESVGNQGTLSLHKKPTQHPNQPANGKHSRLKKTDCKSHKLAGNDSESSKLNQVKEGRTTKGKSPKKRWLKIWKASDRNSGKKAKKEIAARKVIKKKNEVSSTDEDKNLSTDECNALMGLINLSKG